MRVNAALMRYEFRVVTFAASQTVGSDDFNSVAATTSPTAAFVVTHNIAADLLCCWRVGEIREIKVEVDPTNVMLDLANLRKWTMPFVRNTEAPFRADRSERC